MRHYVRLSQKNYAIDMGIYPLGSCTMKHNPRLNEQVARLPGFCRHPPAAAGLLRAGRAGADPRARPLAARDHRHAFGRDEPEGRRAWRALRHDGDQGGAFRARRDALARCWCRNRRTAPIRRPRRCSAIRCVAVPAREDGTVRAEDVREAARRASGRGRGDHADQPEHLRHLRAGSGGDRRGGARGGRATSTATAPTSTPSWARRSRASSASTPCTSTCTRPSPRRMAAAVRAPGRWCCRRRSRRSRRCPSSRATATASGWSSTRRTPATQSRFGRMSAFHGQMGMFVRAYAWMLSHGSDGMRQASEDAVLNANYIRAGLQGHHDACPSPTIRRCTRRCSTTAS